MLSSRSIVAGGFLRCAVQCFFISGIIWLCAHTIPAQTGRFERHLNIPANSKITLSNARTVSIESWDKNEVWIEANASTSILTDEEIKIQLTNPRLDITCQPSRPDENISVTLHLPSQAILNLQTEGNKIEVKNPTGKISFILTQFSIEVEALSSAKLDLQDVAQARKYELMSDRGFGIAPVGHHTLGQGPPFVKFAQTNAQVIINRASVQAYRVDLPPVRPLTVAAQMIARRNTLMSAESA